MGFSKVVLVAYSAPFSSINQKIKMRLQYMSKQVGLVLSDTFQTEFLLSSPKHNPSLLSYFWRSQSGNTHPDNKDLRLFQIHNRFCLMVSNSEMTLFSIEPGKDLLVEQSTKLQFEDRIVRVETNWMLPFENILVIVVLQSELILFTLDFGKKELVRKSSIKIKQINSITFVNGSTFWVVSKHSLLTEVECGGFVFNKTRELAFNKGNIPSIHHGTLVTPDITGKQYHFYYFFFTRSNENKLFLETIYVTELIKKQDGSVVEGALFKIKELECINPVFNGVSIEHNKDIFWLSMEDEIVLIKKKFNSYYFMDTIRKKDPETIMRLLRGGTLCVISKGSAELSTLAVTEPKCAIQVFDLLMTKVDDDYQFFEVLKLHDEYLFLFKSKQNPFKMRLAVTKVEDGMNKITQCHLDGVPMSMIDHMAKILKIPKKDFYIRLWYESSRDISDIRNKLLLCEDVGLIKDEIKLCLRKKNNSISQVIEIYSWFYELVRFQMAKQLNIGYVRIAAECHFLLRKLKIQTDQTAILGLKQLGQIKNKSIINSLQQTILNQIKFSTLCTKERDKIKREKSLSETSSIIVKSENVLRNIFHQFRYSLLENYDTNLLQLLRPFGKDLGYIFEKFPFLIPSDPCEFQFSLKQLTLHDVSSSEINKSSIIKNTSNNIFSSLNEFEWQTEMSVSEIRRYLLLYHPTSTVETLLTEFINDENFKKLRLRRHATIYSTIQDYLLNVKQSISGIKLHLKIIQFSNIINWKDQEDLQEIIEQLADIFRRKNNLTGDNLQNVRLYGRLHALLIRNNFEPLMTMEGLIEIKPDQLISSFFLGKRQKINLIFNELKDIFDNITGSEVRFNKMIEEFVSSDNCSPVELKLLLFYVDKKGKLFQDDNQSLILSLVDGFCKRIEVGERQKIQEFTEALSNVSLSLELNSRIMNIIKIKELDELFREFKCEKQTLHTVEYQGLRVLSRMLQNYFVHEMYFTSLNIQQEIISLETPRNMLNVLIYLQQQLYSSIVELKQVVLMFGERLVEYQAFSDLKQFIQEKYALQRMDIDPVQYAQEVIRSSFYKLYNEPGSFNQMKEHIQEIIKLKIQDTAYLQQEFLRIKLCQLINDCNFDIHPNDLGHGTNKVDFMWQFVEEGYQNLCIDKIEEIYYCFKRMSGDRSDNIDQHLLLYVTLFTKTCIKNQRLQAGIEGIIYLLRNDCFDMIWETASEAFLQHISQKYLQQSKETFEYIQYFCVIIQQSKIKDLINLFIQQELVSEEDYCSNEDEILQVHQSLIYLKLRAIDIKLKDLRDIARKIGVIPKNIFRYYYFSISILSQPEKVSITHIHYNISFLDDLVDLLCKKLSLKTNYVGINLNEYLFRKCFLNALCEYGCYLTNSQTFKIDSLTNFDDELLLMNMIEKLKESNENVLLKVIRKNIRFLQENKMINASKERKVKKYEQSILDQINAITIDTNMLPSRQKNEMQSRSLLEEKKANKNMTLREFLSVTMNASMNNPTLNQKQIIQMIKEDSFRPPEEPQKKLPSPIRERRLTVRHTNFQQFQLYLQQEYFQLFDNKKYYEIECKERSEMIKYLKQYYQSDRDIGSFIKLLQGLKLAEERNIKIVQSALRVNTPNIDLKKLFKFDFYFYTPDTVLSDTKATTAEFFAHVFQYLVPSIKEIIRYDTWLMLSKIICVSLKFEKEYEYKVIIFALESFLADYESASSHFEENLDEFLSKLAVSSVFLAKHYREPLAACESVDVWRCYLEKVLECLKGDQGISRLEQTQRQFVENTITDIECSLSTNDFDQQ